MAKGWRPTGAGASPAPAPDDETPTPAPPRRRRRPLRGVGAQYAIDTPRLDAAEQQSPRVHTGDVKHPPGNHKQDSRISLTIQLGDRWSRIVRDVKAGEYTWAEFCDGLSEEELARGQLKDSEGGFRGRPPVFVPREFLLACQREQKRRFEEIFGSEVLGIATEYVKLCKDASIPGKDRAKLMQYAMERIFGGIPKDIRVSSEQPWEEMFVNVFSGDGDGSMPEHLARRYAGYQERLGGTDE